MAQFLIIAGVFLVGVIAMVVFAGGMMVISSLIDGWVLTKLWAWFVVPLLGLPSLSLPVAVGLSAIVFLFTPSRRENDEGMTTSDKVSRVIVAVFVKPLVALGIGYVALQFMAS